MTPARTNAAKARDAWGDALPDWVLLLAKVCDQGNQATAAKAIRYSSPVVNAVVNNTYKGNLAAVKRAVEGAFLNATVDCPVLETIPAQRCLSEQRRPLSGANPWRVALWRACRAGCAHFQGQRAETPAIAVPVPKKKRGSK
jgi:hypothetical protein